ncbi:MAG: hypothetical protein ABI758_01645 [Candidatus Woesebacteria bacterium]
MASGIFERFRRSDEEKQTKERYTERKKKRRSEHTSPERQNTFLPQRENFPFISNPNIHELDGLKPGSPEWNTKRQAEVEFLGSRIDALPLSDFDTMREDEMDRLNSYFDAFAETFGIDLRAVALTRTQIMKTILMSTMIWIQSMFEDDDHSKMKDDESKGAVRTFFDSRMHGGKFQFNANGTRIIKGLKVIFSVLKRESKDEQGEFEVDYPVYSIPREICSALHDWNQANFKEKDLSENPLIKLGTEVASRRVHDWLHAAILYDTQALTLAFKEWSENSWFVPHLFDGEGMINYELLSNHMHFEVYQQMFKKDPDSKKFALGQIKDYIGQVESFTQWLITENEVSSEDANRYADYLMNIVTRGVFDYIKYDDPELLAVVSDSKRFMDARESILEDFGKYLDAVYSLQDKLIPFRKGTDQKLPIPQILEEYVRGLHTEASAVRDQAHIDQLWRNENEDAILARLPREIQEELRRSGLTLAEFDPRLLQKIGDTCEKLREHYSPEIYKTLVQRIEVDKAGLFYLKLDRKDVFTVPEASLSGVHVEIGGMREVIQQKQSLLVQVPYGHTEEIKISVKRMKNLLKDQIGATVKVKPGDVILINTQNEALANELLERSYDSKTHTLNIETLLVLANQNAQKGLVEFDDVYPVSPQNASQVFGLEEKGVMHCEDDQCLIVPGFYKTLPNTREASVIDGPVSMDAYNDESGGRNRILSGVLVKNHVQKRSEDLDIFPVDGKSFRTLYPSSQKAKLNHMTVNDTFLLRNGITKGSPHPRAEFQDAMEELLDNLSAINLVKLHGFRGKPQLLTFEEYFRARQGGEGKRGSKSLLNRIRRK